MAESRRSATSPLGAPALLGALLVVATTVSGCTHSSYADAPEGMKIGVAYSAAGPLDGLVNESAHAGVKAFKASHAGTVGSVHEFSAVADEPVEDRYDRLIILCESGYDPVIAIGDGYVGPDPTEGPLARAARTCPRTRFAIVADTAVTAPNVADLVFADPQGAYLMGVAAARTSRLQQVGFLGSCHTPPFVALEVAYRAGVAAAAPDTEVTVKYLTDDENVCPDEADEGAARLAANGLYDSGADVVYQAVGTAGAGVFEAAKEHAGWAIGTGADQYRTADPPVRDAILTSQVDRVDLAVTDLLNGVARGSFHAGVTHYDVGNGGIRYATSGGHLGALGPVLDGYARRITDGTIAVPGSP